MPIAYRVLFIVAAVLLIPFAVYAGEGFGVAADVAQNPAGYGMVVTIVGAAGLVAAGCVAIYGPLAPSAVPTNDLTLSLFAFCSAVLLSLTFGSMAKPFVSFGLWPWTWGSHWAVLLVLGFVPISVETVRVARELRVDSRRQRIHRTA